MSTYGAPHRGEGASSYQLPGPSLTVPAQEEALPVRRTDWERIRSRVNSIGQPTRYASNLAWTMVGVAVAALLAWLPWQATYGQLPSRTRLNYDWISPTLVVGAIAAVIVAVLAFASARTTKRLEGENAVSIVADMDSLHQPHLTTRPLSGTDTPHDQQEHTRQGLEIVGGEWGISGQIRDVTTILRNALTKDGSLRISVDSTSLGGDPAPGRAKRLIIIYRLPGETQTRRAGFDEGEMATLKVTRSAGR